MVYLPLLLPPHIFTIGNIKDAASTTLGNSTPVRFSIWDGACYYIDDVRIEAFQEQPLIIVLITNKNALKGDINFSPNSTSNPFFFAFQNNTH